ncbi:hypothetical protein [Kitasatospora sp. NPDC085464]|uniref:hypothetical protein n=1 Tax=Kitasatospora sp. NPDC085464 TaxID=3364063 RepID=UPI0037C721EC
MTDRTASTALLAAGAAAFFAAISVAAAARACRCPVEHGAGGHRAKRRPHIGHVPGGGGPKGLCPNPPNCN